MKYVNVQLVVDDDANEEDAQAAAHVAEDELTASGLAASVVSVCLSDAPIVLSSDVPRG